jgi:hypothetical protein
MNTLRCFLLGTIVLISSSTLALGGIMQTPGHSDPPPPPPDSATSTASTEDGLTVSTTTDENQLAWQEITTVLLRDILLTMY